MNRTSVLKAGAAALALTLLCNPAWGKDNLVKKTLDGRCLAPDHPEYWETNIYVAKPSMEACVKSGGKKAE